MSGRNSPRSLWASALYAVAIFGAMIAFFAPGTLRVFHEEHGLTGLEFLTAQFYDYIALFSPFLMMAALARAVQYLADIKRLLRQDEEGEDA